MEDIPTEILENLLSRLTIESTLSKPGLLFAFGDTNNLSAESDKQVQLYYGDQYEVNLKKDYSRETLAKLDYVKYSLPYNLHNHMVGSCNGLVCLHTHNKGTNNHSCIICYPITGEFLVLPGSKVPEFQGWHTVGFGYVPYINKYKVVRISYQYLNQQQGHVEVYTLGSQLGWRKKENFHYRFYSPGIFVNGAIHWWGGTGRKRRSKIIAYDLPDEKFRYVPSPPFDYKKRDGIVRLMLLGGNLCAIHHKSCVQILDIWAFKRNILNNRRAKKSRINQPGYYDHNWSWSKELSISHDPKMYEPFAITKSNEVLLWHEHKNLS